MSAANPNRTFDASGAVCAKETESPICSLVIPAFREIRRLPRYLRNVRPYLTNEYGTRYEVVVVDDGSDDGLFETLEAIQADWPQLRILRNASNQGKGAAVRLGILKSAGDILLYADADGATPISEERKLRAAIEAGADVAIGSRRLASDVARRTRDPLRQAGSWLFRLSVKLFVDLPARDTQCGFKMFRREIGKRLFSLCDEDGYLFDVVVLCLAGRLGYKVLEVDVSWQEIAGSKVRLVRDFCKMLFGLRSVNRRVDAILRAEVYSVRTKTIPRTIGNESYLRSR